METVPVEVELRLGTRVGELPGVDERRESAYRRLGIETVSDLVRHLPVRYEQEWGESPIGELVMDGVCSARGEIVATRVVPGWGRSKARFEAEIEDHSGSLILTWFNAVYLREKLHPSMTVLVQGKVVAYKGKPQIVNPKWEVLEEPEGVSGREQRLRPVYRATEGKSVV